MKKGCWFFQVGRCSKGDECSFPHIQTITEIVDGSRVTLMDLDIRKQNLPLKTLNIITHLKDHGIECCDDFQLAKSWCADSCKTLQIDPSCVANEAAMLLCGYWMC